MYPDIFSVLDSDAGVQAQLGSSPCRAYPAGEAPGPGRNLHALPYAVFQVITGAPENTMSCAPDIDRFAIQIDVYAKTVSGARAAAEAIRDAIQERCHITTWRGMERDPETKLYRYSFDCDWWENR